MGSANPASSQACLLGTPDLCINITEILQCLHGSNSALWDQLLSTKAIATYRYLT